MELYEAMSTLRAVRRLKPDPIPDEVLERVLQAIAWAPTGGNVQPFRVVAVRDRDNLARIGQWYTEEWGRYTQAMRNAAQDEPDGSGARTLAAGDYLCEHFGDVPVLLVFCFNAEHMAITDAHLDRPSVVGGGSVYTAVENALLAARAEGLGCVLTTLLCFKEPELKQLLGIPDPWGTCAHVPIGYPVLRGHGPISRRPFDKLTYLDTWGERYPTRGDT